MHGGLHELRRKLAPDAAPMTDSHLSVATIASYVDGALDAGARADADRHLATCAVCRCELTGVADLVVDLPSARRGRSWRTIAGALAAAAVVGVLFVSPARAPDRAETTERTTRAAAATLEIVEPLSADGTAGVLRDGRIAWRAVEQQATYRVTVTDTTGATRWSADTPDTTVVIPLSARLAPGARYYLYVDAQRADGWSLQSGPRLFTTP
jgi:anti-sigma factor RsiW